MTSNQSHHLKFMRRALDLAAKGNNRVRSNPKVGCVIVRNGRIVSSGFHSTFGGPHAEIIALKKAGNKASGSTVYLTLEPCVHTGKKTPPCVPALISAKVRRIVIAIPDPNPRVYRKGILGLRKAGIEVFVGTLRKSAEKINRPFFTWVKKKRPYIVLKLACTLDGKITSRSRWISNKQALHRVQILRAQSDAILVGVNTVISDNPRLSCRIRGARQPLRVVLDSKLLSPLFSKVFRDSNAFVFTTKKADPRKIAALSKRKISCVVFPGKIVLKEVLRHLARKNIATLMVEGGAIVASSFLREKLVDRGFFFVAPALSPNGKSALDGYLDRKFVGTTATVLGDNALFDLDFHPKKE